MNNGVPLRVDYVALHLAALATEKAHEILLGERVIVVGESSKIAVLVDAFCVERASQVSHHGRAVNRPVPPLRVAHPSRNTRRLLDTKG